MGASARPAVVEEYDSVLHRSSLVGEVRELLRYRDLLGLLISRTIKTRYKRSVLGVAWTLLNPLINMTVMTIAFSAIFRTAIPRYPVYLLIGLVAWGFFSQSTAYAMGTLVWGGSLIKRVYIPRTIFAVACVGNGLVNLFFSLIPLLAIMLVMGHPLHGTWWFFPIAILILSAFSLGVALLVSTLAVLFADVVDMYQVMLQAWFFLTPIIYPEDIIPSHYAWLLELNPMHHMIMLVRDPIFMGRLPDPVSIATAATWALVALVGGAWYFSRKADAFAYSI